MEKHLIKGEESIVKALDALNRLSGETMTLFVVDSDRRLLGSLTDGDIRRALLEGHNLTDNADSICHHDCLRLTREYDTSVVKTARSKGVFLLPIVDPSGTILSLLDLRRSRGLVPADALLMAGGIGERLRPLTDTIPKPLLPVGDKPIIDHNIRLLREFGIENISVAVNYRKEQIIDHLKDEGIKIIEEPYKLGTIGALSLMPVSNQPDVLVMNADLLTNIDLEAMYLRHIETEAWLTMATVPYTVSVPYAIVEHSGDRITGFSEKPTFNYYANAGIYLIRREAVKYVPKGSYTDATDLIETLIREEKRVSLFSISGRWIDIGSPDDYRHACEIMKGLGD